MRYQGGKFRMHKHIVPLLLQTNPERIVEPFVGGGHIMTNVIRAGFSGEYIAGDFDQDLTATWRAVAQGWYPTDEDAWSKEQYDQEKARKDAEPTPLRGVMRTAATFGAKPWSTYSLNKPGCKWSATVNSVRKDAETLIGKNVRIIGGDYRTYEEFITPNSVVYCDPPYAETIGYGHPFDMEAFWQTVREWSAICLVYVSELTAPDDFVPVFVKEIAVGTGRITEGELRPRMVDCVFIHESRVAEELPAELPDAA